MITCLGATNKHVIHLNHGLLLIAMQLEGRNNEENAD